MARSPAAEKPMAAGKHAAAKKTAVKPKGAVKKPAPKAAPKTAAKAKPKAAAPKAAAKKVVSKAPAAAKKVAVKEAAGKPKPKVAAGKVASTKPVAKQAAKAQGKPVSAKAAPTKAPTSSSTEPKKAPASKKATAHPVEKLATKPAPAKQGTAKPASVKPSATPNNTQKPGQPVAVTTTPVATKPQARASAKSPVHMPLPAIPTQAEQASRFADRFAPPKPVGRVLVDAPDPQKSARKDPKLAQAWKTKRGSELSEDELLAMPDTEYMNEKQLEFFRVRLTTLKTDLLSNAGETTEHLREDTSVVPDPADRATIEEEHALELRTRDRERKLLKKISQSLARIEAGDYGYCDETGEPIGVARLLARPTATLSLEAQQRRELKQKMFGD